MLNVNMLSCAPKHHLGVSLVMTPIKFVVQCFMCDWENNLVHLMGGACNEYAYMKH